MAHAAPPSPRADADVCTLKDAGIPRDLVEHEARKWPWQKWNSQWQELDEALLRKIADRR